MPLLSSAVRVTVALPISLQPKLFGVTERVGFPQSSRLPPSTVVVDSVAFPLFKVTDPPWHTAVGVLPSATVTFEMQESWLPAKSMT